MICFKRPFIGTLRTNALLSLANYHKPLGEHLIKCGRMVVLVSEVAVKRNRELLDGRWDKHDTKGSANIADLISRENACFKTGSRCSRRPDWI